MNKIKIAHITTIDISLKNLLLAQLTFLSRTGYEIVGISSTGESVKDIEAAGIRHINVPISRNLTPLADLVSLWRLFSIMRKERFMIVHTHTPKPGLLGQLAAKMAGIPIIVNTLHGFYFHENMSSLSRCFYITLEKIAALCSDMILSQNKEDIQTAIAEGICLQEKIHYLGNGINISQFTPERFSEEEILLKRRDLGLTYKDRVIGFVGRLAGKRKGFLDFLKAGQQLVKRDKNVRFLIIGGPDPSKPDAVDPEIAKDYGIWEQCSFLGWQPNTELPMLYSLMDVLVLPSLFEGIPRVVMEASAMGIPVVATDVRGNREAVEDGVNGCLVPLGNIEALTNAIYDILYDQEKAQRMSKEGRILALEKFDENHVFDKIKLEYNNLLLEKGFS